MDDLCSAALLDPSSCQARVIGRARGDRRVPPPSCNWRSWQPGLAIVAWCCFSCPLIRFVAAVRMRTSRRRPPLPGAPATAWRWPVMTRWRNRTGRSGRAARGGVHGRVRAAPVRAVTSAQARAGGRYLSPGHGAPPARPVRRRRAPALPRSPAPFSSPDRVKAGRGPRSCGAGRALGNQNAINPRISHRVTDVPAAARLDCRADIGNAKARPAARGKGQWPEPFRWRRRGCGRAEG
jgi:hypothetical protein